jgi:sulfite reductase beta subunit-like hemoprotein
MSQQINSEEIKKLSARYRLDGIYKQRGDNDYCMVRVRQSGGACSTKDMLNLADLGDKYSNGTLHLAVRQDIQFHWIRYKDLNEFLYDMSMMGMTSRDACGDCVRNVTACQGSGVCDQELINVAKFSEEYAKIFRGNSKYEKLPRKFKISLSGCNMGCALPQINDVGLMAIKNEKGELGFEGYLAGGLGRQPRVPNKTIKFLPLDLAPVFLITLVELFDEMGNRESRKKARLKFVFDNIGDEKMIWIIKGQLTKNGLSEEQIDRIKLAL